MLLLLGGLGTTIAATLFAGRQWVWARQQAHVAAAVALRDEGTRRVQLGHVGQAMAMYNLSIDLYSEASDVFHLRGLLHAANGDLPQAIADWKKSLERQPHNNAAEQALAQICGSANR